MTSTVHQGDNINISGPYGIEIRSVINDRKSQQDACVATPALLAVADGLGGHRDGAAASHAALTALATAITGPCTLTELLAGADEAQHAVAALAQWRNLNPGTTLVAVAISDDGQHVHGIWSGDSRIWLLNENEPARSLTEDHAGFYGGLEACLGDHGSSAAYRVDTFTLEIGAGHQLLLCTDGIHGALGDDYKTTGEEITELVTAGGIDALVAEATRRGSDNATAIVVDVDQWAQSHTA